MADRFDVSARLAEGRPAVGHTQTYVNACHQLGYQQPDLTAHTSQIWDWYDAEVGLDLQLLDNDTGALVAAVNAIEEALWVQRTQVTGNYPLKQQKTCATTCGSRSTARSQTRSLSMSAE